MKQFRSLMDRIFPPIQPLPAGIYHYQAPADADFPYRLHLRIEEDGQGLLIVNASTVVHLNPTATEYAYHLVQATPEEEAIAQIAKRYNVRKEVVRQDFADLRARIETLIDTPDLDPVAYLDFERDEPYSGVRSAPYRIDCALTYRLPDEGAGSLAPVDRVKRELTREEWTQVFDKAWEAGIPHAVLTGGEPTLRPDLTDLIAHAEKLGMVTGLITNGLRLAETGYLHDLLLSGLDHVTILLDPAEDQCWEALRDTLAEDIAVTVHLTLTQKVLPDFNTILDRLVEMGVQNLSLSADTLDLKSELQADRDALAERQLHLIWDMPVPYSQFHPVAVELAEGTPDRDVVSTGPGRGWLYIEPDGDVLPGQGYYQTVLGNMLTDSWETIWKNASENAPG
ncbi:MAG: radical SAM protein [Chloroflexi bacterium]|nr:radical SAM protein [Chloroflexota bacterium]